MCPQFVDFDGDEYTDIITATYEGVPSLVRGSADGWQQPEHLQDAEGNDIMLAVYWDDENSRWSVKGGETMQQYAPEKHCVSAAAFDWDGDDDYDLLLGAYEGQLVLRRNEGEIGAPAFATENEVVEAGGEPFVVKGGLTAPRLVDWDGDGLTDLVCGGFKGGVFLYRNAGEEGAPKFEKAVTLIEPGVISPSGVKFPNSGCYVDPVDYDGDGDLDLLVGGYAEWTPHARELSDEEQARVEELQKLREEAQTAMQDSMAEFQNELTQAENQEERQAIYERMMDSEPYKTAHEKWREIYTELSDLQPMGNERQAGVWLYRRK